MIKYIKLGLVIFVASCATNTQLQNRAINDCEIIYGRASDWENISDDLARNIYKNNLKCELY
jgi:hypothetical protein